MKKTFWLGAQNEKTFQVLYMNHISKVLKLVYSPFNNFDKQVLTLPQSRCRHWRSVGQAETLPWRLLPRRQVQSRRYRYLSNDCHLFSVTTTECLIVKHDMHRSHNIRRLQKGREAAKKFL